METWIALTLFIVGVEGAQAYRGQEMGLWIAFILFVVVAVVAGVDCWMHAKNDPDFTGPR